MAHGGGAIVVFVAFRPFMIGLGLAVGRGARDANARRPGSEGARGHSIRADPCFCGDTAPDGTQKDYDRVSDRPDLSPLGRHAHPRHGSGTLGRVDPGKVPQGSVSGRLMACPLRKGSPIMRYECPHA